MKTLHGDLIQLALDGRFDVIVHGCNCFHTMGAGIAKAIAVQFPEALRADKSTGRGDRRKLGTISTASVTTDHGELVVVNAYTQFQWKGRGRKADYRAIELCFEEVARRYPSSRIGYPMIGAGLAGGDWNAIEPLISIALEDLDHTLVIYQA